MVLVWVGGALAVAAATGLLARRRVQQRAAGMLAAGIEDAERRVMQLLGGTARIELDGEPLPILLALRDDRVPAGRLVLERARLPNGLDVRHAELTSTGAGDDAQLVARITPRAISRQLGVPGVSVVVHRERLRLVLGMASVVVHVRVVDNRVVLSIPVAPPPLGGLLSTGLTELVPPPPTGVDLRDVTIADGEVVVQAVVDLRSAVELVRLDDTAT